jgi:hypothetical protein
MTRRHRSNPARRRQLGYRVDVWRSVAVLITDEDGLEPAARRLLAASLVHVFSTGPAPPSGMEFPADARDPNAFIATIRSLYDNGYLGIEDGRAYLSVPDRDPLGRLVRIRVPAEQFGDLADAYLRRPDDPS